MSRRLWKISKAILSFLSCALHDHPHRMVVPTCFFSFLFGRAGVPRDMLFKCIHCDDKSVSSCTVSLQVMHVLDWILSLQWIKTKDNPVVMYESPLLGKHEV